MATTAIGVFWLTVLPYVGEQPSVSDHVANQKRLGIDPSALFYTELEIAPDIAHRVERLQESHSTRFWNVSESQTTPE